MGAALFNAGRLQLGDALIVVDVQNDFLPGGRRPVPDGNAVIAPLNHCIEMFERLKLPIFAARDWHPPDHCSFQSQGGLWPPHCIADTHGADFAASLKLPASAYVVSKATVPGRDTHSGFEGTDLEAELRTIGARRLFVGGLSTEYGVLQTVQDGLRCGFKVLLLTDAIRAYDEKPGDGERAKRTMQRRGAIMHFATRLSQ